MSAPCAPLLDSTQPVYAPILQVQDRDVIVAGGPLDAAVLPATCSVRPPLAALLEAARRVTSCLIVDPKTPFFQYEGYMGMEDLRALPYGPGRGTLGELWVPDHFSTVQARQRLISEVATAQRACHADVILPPYFYVREAAHPWLAVNRKLAVEALERDTPEPVAVPIAVRLDAITDATDRRVVLDAYTDLRPAIFWVNIIDFDEVQASPDEVRAVLAVFERLGATGVPVLPAYLGRTGLIAIARGTAGYCSGLRAQETHPVADYREGVGAQVANSYYLHRHMIHLRAPIARAVLDEVPDGDDPCDCDSCSGGRPVDLMVRRQLVAHALRCRHREIEELSAVSPHQREETLRQRFTRALTLCRDAAVAVGTRDDGHPRVPNGTFHYLEVLIEVTGGPAASIPDFDDF